MSRNLNFRSLLALVTDAAIDPDTASTVQDHSDFERFAIPYKFQPRLRLTDAVMFALRTFLRISLGSLLFAAWGAYTLLAWASIHNPFLRTAAIVPLFALFLALLGGMLIVTSWLHRARRP